MPRTAHLWAGTFLRLHSQCFFAHSRVLKLLLKEPGQSPRGQILALGEEGSVALARPPVPRGDISVSMVHPSLSLCQCSVLDDRSDPCSLRAVCPAGSHPREGSPVPSCGLCGAPWGGSAGRRGWQHCSTTQHPEET